MPTNLPLDPPTPVSITRPNKPSDDFYELSLSPTTSAPPRTEGVVHRKPTCCVLAEHLHAALNATPQWKTSRSGVVSRPPLVQRRREHQGAERAPLVHPFGQTEKSKRCRAPLSCAAILPFGEEENRGTLRRSGPEDLQSKERNPNQQFGPIKIRPTKKKKKTKEKKQRKQ